MRQVDPANVLLQALQNGCDDVTQAANEEKFHLNMEVQRLTKVTVPTVI